MSEIHLYTNQFGYQSDKWFDIEASRCFTSKPSYLHIEKLYLTKKSNWVAYFDTSKYVQISDDIAAILILDNDISFTDLPNSTIQKVNDKIRQRENIHQQNEV